jgi:hypothetical protein
LLVVFFLLVIIFDEDKVVPITFQLNLQVAPVFAEDSCLFPMFRIQCCS